LPVLHVGRSLTVIVATGGSPGNPDPERRLLPVAFTDLERWDIRSSMASQHARG